MACVSTLECRACSLSIEDFQNNFERYLIGLFICFWSYKLIDIVQFIFHPWCSPSFFTFEKLNKYHFQYAWVRKRLWLWVLIWWRFKPHEGYECKPYRYLDLFLFQWTCKVCDDLEHLHSKYCTRRENIYHNFIVGEESNALLNLPSKF